MKLQTAYDYLKPIADAASISNYAEALNTALTCVQRCIALDKANIVKMPKIRIIDTDNNSVHNAGEGSHDRLYSGGYSIAYRNLQNCESTEPGSCYRFADREIEFVDCIEVNSDIIPKPPKVVPGHCEICGRDYDVMDFSFSTDFEPHSVCRTCARMPEQDIKELPYYQRKVVDKAKVVLLTEKFVDNDVDDD